MQVARNYTAQTLNLATGKSLTQYDVIAVSAMEAAGVAPAVNLHNDISGGHIPHRLQRAPKILRIQFHVTRQGAIPSRHAGIRVKVV